MFSDPLVAAEQAFGRRAQAVPVCPLCGFPRPATTAWGFPKCPICGWYFGAVYRNERSFWRDAQTLRHAWIEHKFVPTLFLREHWTPDGWNPIDYLVDLLGDHQPLDYPLPPAEDDHG